MSIYFLTRGYRVCKEEEGVGAWSKKCAEKNEKCPRGDRKGFGWEKIKKLDLKKSKRHLIAESKKVGAKVWSRSWLKS